MASPVGEDNWVDFVDHQLRGATDFEGRVRILLVALFRLPAW